MDIVGTKDKDASKVLSMSKPISWLTRDGDHVPSPGIQNALQSENAYKVLKNPERCMVSMVTVGLEKARKQRFFDFKERRGSVHLVFDL